LNERLGSCRLSGGAALRALLDVGESGFSGEVVCDATGLGVAAGKNFKRIKSAGTPLELKLSGRLEEDAAGDLRISLEDSQVQLGASRLGASGSIVRKLPVESAATSVPADGSLASCQLKFSGQCAIDEAVKGLLPEIAELAAKQANRVQSAGNIPDFKPRKKNKDTEEDEDGTNPSSTTTANVRPPPRFFVNTGRFGTMAGGGSRRSPSGRLL